MPLTIEGGFALILTGTIVPERVVIMTTSFVYFILAVICIFLGLVRTAAAAAERLAQETPKPVIEEIDPSVLEAQVEERAQEMYEAMVQARADFVEKHGRDVKHFTDRNLKDLFSGGARKAASAAILFGCLFAVGCGGLRPSSVPSFGEQREYNCRVTGPDGTVWLGVWNREAIAESEKSGPEARRQLNREMVCIPKVVVFKVGDINCVGSFCMVSKKR